MGYLVRIIRGKRNDVDRCRRFYREGKLVQEGKPRAEALGLLLGVDKTTSNFEVNPVSVYLTPTVNPQELAHALGVLAFVVGQTKVTETLDDRVPGRVYATLLISEESLGELGVALDYTPNDCTTFYPTLGFKNHRDLCHDPREHDVETELLGSLIEQFDTSGQLIRLPLRPEPGAPTSFEVQLKIVVDHCRSVYALAPSPTAEAGSGYDEERWCDCAELPAQDQVERTRYLAAQLGYDWGAAV